MNQFMWRIQPMRLGRKLSARVLLSLGEFQKIANGRQTRAGSVNHVADGFHECRAGSTVFGEGIPTRPQIADAQNASQLHVNRTDRNFKTGCRNDSFLALSRVRASASSLVRRLNCLPVVVSS